MARLVVVGGQVRKVGKTSLVTALIRAFPQTGWTAVKISGHAHGTAAPALVEEKDRSGKTDTARFLQAGAARAFWVQCPAERLAEMVPRLQELAKREEAVIIESTSLLEILEPAVALLVLDPGREDFKDSARAHLERVDAFVTFEARDRRASPSSPFPSGSPRPVFALPPGEECPPALREFVRERLWGRPEASA